MGQLVMVEFLSVDGVTQGVGSADEDTRGGFTRGGWGAEYAAAMGQVVQPDGLAATSAYLLGRTTYEKLAAYWPGQPDTDPMAAHLNSTPKYVLSHTMTKGSWAPTTVLPGEFDSSVREVKAASAGDVVVLGSGLLCRQLLAHDLVDQLRLFVHPLLLGGGQRLFGDLPETRRLALRRVGQTDLGTLSLVYDVVR